MQLKRPTNKDIREWKDIYEKYKDALSPNKKSGLEIIEFLKAEYSAIEINDAEWESIVSDNILLNEFFNSKLCGATPIIKLFRVNDEKLLSCQDEVFAHSDIIVGVELNTAYIYVQGSGKLYDELVVFAGLDEYDLQNYFLVAQYIKLKHDKS